ncbi:MAG TPA: 2-dehydropantoate 2-reductase [Candidatus Limnocylindrales bacterium]|nr:2-dehydropantoate 2-reductase [Candidatus Limnocylindrales bacterium]
MSVATSQPKVAVVGAGAVGCYFGGMLARAGVPVVLIGRRALVDAVQRSGLFLDTVQFQETVHPEASTDLSAAASADVVLFCVKTTDTAGVARNLKGTIRAHALVVSLQNGVNNAEEVRAASGIDAFPAVVYVAASVPSPGSVKHLGRGDLVLGPKNEKTEKIASLFASASVPCRISENIEGELWTKLIWNCALNAVSALGRVTYGEIIASLDAKQVVEAAVRETLNVARAKGIHPPGLEDPRAALAGSFKIAEQMSGTRSSTAQDMARGKRTEIDSLNGHVARVGAQLGVATPVNHALYTLVKLQELGFPAKS